MIYLVLCLTGLLAGAIILLKLELDRAHERENQVRMQLLSVLGKTETIALTVEDQRPLGAVHYIDEATEAALEQRHEAQN